ncbi:MAG TPA: S-layer homology domain-containing protein [Sporosarcina psychrophila]|uniref:S-layer homology domain-containing protein n=1 Tax=Sporosarcina psychrophila TaxID=1476 RepID=A0A921KES1_SPOPS|nr:S-layer homology domain-containing protein [Sporosarcina psychrophila]
MLKSKLAAAWMTLTLLLLFAIIPSQVQASARFFDVDQHWAKKEIMYLSDRNIIGGYPDGTIKPNKAITRAQASAMLIKALNIPLTEDTSVQFKDVSKNSPSYKILATVNEKGILRGDNGFMRPGKITSRAQMAAILRRAFDLPLDKQATFVDVTPAHWAYQDINGIAKQRIAGGSDGKYMPANPVTRAQFSAFLVRALDDKMKLSSYHSYVSVKGKAVEHGGSLYTIPPDCYTCGKLIKQDLKTGASEVLLSNQNFSSDAIYIVRFHEGFPLIVYNEEIFIPFWSAVHEMTDVPFSYGLIRTKTSVEDAPIDSSLMQGMGGRTFRNLFIWNDRIYYTNEKNQDEPYLNWNFNQDIPQDSPLILYSTAMDGSNQRKESAFNTRIIFDDVSAMPSVPYVNQSNKSVLYDHSTMYYFNKAGVFKYSLLDKKSSKISNVLAKDMEATTTQLIVTDQKGKKHTLKK